MIGTLRRILKSLGDDAAASFISTGIVEATAPRHQPAARPADDLLAEALGGDDATPSIGMCVVSREQDGRPAFLERDGVLWEPVRASDREKREREIDEARIQDRIVALAGERGEEVRGLLWDYQDVKLRERTDDEDALLRRVGGAIVKWGVPHLW